MNTSVRRAGDMYCFLFYQTLTRGSLGGHLVYLLTTFLDRTLPYFLYLHLTVTLSVVYIKEKLQILLGFIVI